MLLFSLEDELEDAGAYKTTFSPSQRALAAEGQIAVAPLVKRAPDAYPNFIWVGREPRCDVSLPFEGISKLHAQFIIKPDGAVDLLDAGSTNGTFIDAVRLGPHKAARVSDGAQIRFGKFEVRFRTAESFWMDISAEMGRL